MVERIGLAGLVGEVLVQPHRLVERAGGGRVVAGQLLQQAELVERSGLAGQVRGQAGGAEGGLVLRRGLVPVTPRRRKPPIAVAIAIACPGMASAANPTAACKLGRSASSQPAASSEVASGGALPGGRPGGWRPPAVVQVAMRCRRPRRRARSSPSAGWSARVRLLPLGGERAGVFADRSCSR